MSLSTISFIYSVTYSTVMKKEEHLSAFEEHRAVIDWAIDRGIERSQRIIAAHASRGALELLSYYLHKLNMIDPGFQINHRWFKSPQVGNRLPEFEKKGLILPKLVRLENICENLTYGSQKQPRDIKEIVELFNEVERLLNELMSHEK